MASRTIAPAALVASLAFVFGGCSLLVSTSGFSTDSEGSPDSTTTDGPSAPDAIVSADAGTDVVTSVDAPNDGPPKPFCSSLSPAPFFCSDFDTGGLNEVFSVSGATLDNDRFVSPGRSVRGVVEASQGERFSVARRDFFVTPKTLRVRFKTRLQAYDASRDVEIVNVRMEVGAGTCNVLISARAGDYTIDEYCEGTSNPVELVHRSPMKSTLAKWTAIDFTVSFVAPKTYSLRIDDVDLFVNQPLAPNMMNGEASVVAGVNYLPPSSGRAEINIDDLAVDLTQ